MAEKSWAHEGPVPPHRRRNGPRIAALAAITLVFVLGSRQAGSALAGTGSHDRFEKSTLSPAYFIGLDGAGSQGPDRMAAGTMAPAVELRAVAILSADPESAEVVRAAQSVAVRAFVLAPGAPAARNELLIDVDTDRLQRELDDKLAELRSIQTERRSGPVAVAQVPGESGTIQELSDLQAMLTSAAVRAPADGFVVRYLVNPGSRTKRRKPVLIFADLSRTLVKATLESEPPEPLSIGSAVRVTSAYDPSRAFRAQLLRLERTSGGATVYVLAPRTLPFLHLNAATEVVLSFER